MIELFSETTDATLELESFSKIQVKKIIFLDCKISKSVIKYAQSADLKIITINSENELRSIKYLYGLLT